MICPDPDDPSFATSETRTWKWCQAVCKRLNPKYDFLRQNFVAQIVYRGVITATKVLEDTPVERQFFENITKLVEKAVTKQKLVDELRAKQQLVAEKEAEEAITR